MPMNNRLLRPRQTIHPEAADWANRVRTNGGSVSGTTLTAVDRFVKAVYTAGIRDRFYRLNLFCGTGLEACLVPLFRGASFGGMTYGNATDTNNNFVAGDYAENNGLQGNGTNKSLATGLQQTYAESNEIHQCVGFIQNAATGYQCLIGARYNVATSVAHEMRGSGPNFRVAAFSGGNALANFSPLAGRNLFLFTRTASAQSYETYIRGALFETRTLGAYSSATSAEFRVFAGDTNGAAAGFFSGSIDHYSIGLRLISTAQIDAYHSAIGAFRTAMGRT